MVSCTGLTTEVFNSSPGTEWTRRFVRQSRHRNKFGRSPCPCHLTKQFARHFDRIALRFAAGAPGRGLWLSFVRISGQRTCGYPPETGGAAAPGRTEQRPGNPRLRLSWETVRESSIRMVAFSSLRGSLGSCSSGFYSRGRTRIFMRAVDEVIEVFDADVVRPEYPRLRPGFIGHG